MNSLRLLKKEIINQFWKSVEKKLSVFVDIKIYFIELFLSKNWKRKYKNLFFS